MSTVLERKPRVDRTFRHEAFLYSGMAGFTNGMSSFIREGLDLGEPVAVMVVAPKIDVLRDGLGPAAGDVHFVDMAELGRNPGRIISSWQQFLSDHGAPGVRARCIGEPIWAGRRADELVEAQRHESLLNIAFDGCRAWIMCPYDVEALGPDVLDEAHGSHPIVSDGGPARKSHAYRDIASIARPFDAPLAEPLAYPDVLAITREHLAAVRSFVGDHAESFGLGRTRTADLVLAVNEAATNSLLHAGGTGVLRIWQEHDALVCEVRDDGYIEQPLAGRLPPSTGQASGLGLWLANQVCDLVQLRSSPEGSVVRMRMLDG